MKYEERPIDEAAKAAKVITVSASMRWKPYSPKSEQYLRGIKGRWQVATDYGWENTTENPETYLVRIGE